MARITMEVPARVVELVHGELELAREINAEAIEMHGQWGEDAPAASAAELARHRRELAETDSLLAQIGWDERRMDAPVSLTGDDEWLGRILYGTVLFVGAKVAEECDRRLDDGFSIEQIVVLQDALTTLLLLLRATGVAA